jgi:hypothetical protein
MTVSVSQSSIAEVRDQLCLDFADGKYLNVVSANLGIQRPPFGFSDDTWRALVKVISLQYKQIRTKFEDILTVILGPKVTQCSSFAVPCNAGDRSAVLVGTKQFPQVGTMVIDEGLPTEETIDYCYIDRYTNTVYFDTPLALSHSAVNAEWETGAIGPVDSLEVGRTVCDTSGFPDPALLGFTYTVNVGRGTPYEYVDEFQSVAFPPSRFVVLTNGAPNPQPGLNTSLGNYVDLTSLPTQENAYYLTMTEVGALPETKGILSADVAGVVTATGGTATSVTVAGPLSTTSPYSGFSVRFTGNVTAALTGKVGYVSINNVNTLFFFNTLPAVPAAGDTFTLIANFEYIRASQADNSVLMRQELPQLLTFGASTKFSVMKPSTTISIAQVQVKSGGWDVIQSDPDHVEILLPSDFLDNDLRSASYIRSLGSAGGSVASAARIIGDTDAAVNSTNAMPLIGVLEQLPGSVRYTYYNPHAWISTEATAGSTQISVNDTTLFPAAGTLRINGVTLVAYTVIDTTTLGVAPLPVDVERGMLVREENIFKFAKPLTGAINIGDTLNFYTNYIFGDIWDIADVWPGPYMWDLFAEIHKQQTVPNNSADTYLSGPTTFSVDRVAGNSVIELKDGSAFPLAVPYNVRVGENSGNVETLAVQQLSLKHRTYTTVSAATPAGSFSIPVTSLAGPLAPANQFPNAGPYRVVLWTSPTVSEVVEVVSTGAGPVLNLSFATVAPLVGGERVVLLSDLIRVAPGMADDHLGAVATGDRFGFYAPETQAAVADTVRPLYPTLTLDLAGTDFSVSGGRAAINFGNAVQPARTTTSAIVALGATVISCVDTSEFPTTDYPYIVTLGRGRGPLYEEKVHVVNNNVGLNQLTLSHGARWSYPTGVEVGFTSGPEENFSYTSRAGSILSTSPYLLIENTHQSVELVAPTVGTNYPRKNGFDFPLRLPVTIEDRIRFMIDLVRAAGVLVTFISKR